MAIEPLSDLQHSNVPAVLLSAGCRHPNLPIAQEFRPLIEHTAAGINVASAIARDCGFLGFFEDAHYVFALLQGHSACYCHKSRLGPNPR